MESWKELESRFNELANDLPSLGVSIQWGAAGEHLVNDNYTSPPATITLPYCLVATAG